MGTKQEDAGLILKLYELRRDEEFRKARRWFDTEFNPRSGREVVELVLGGFSQSEYFRMVLSHWEMVAALVNDGALDAGLLHRTNVEHLRYFAKIEPYLAEIRGAAGEDFLSELERLVKSAPDYEKRLAGWRQLNQQWAETHERERHARSWESNS